MIDEFAKAYLHSDLRDAREAVVWKLDGLGEYDVRRPLTASGTNLLGLVKHLSLWEARYLGDVFGLDIDAPQLLRPAAADKPTPLNASSLCSTPANPADTSHRLLRWSLDFADERKFVLPPG